MPITKLRVPLSELLLVAISLPIPYLTQIYRLESDKGK
jgi:hypothetical protein